MRLWYVLIAMLAITSASCQREQATYLQPSASAIGVPEPEVPFTDYVADSRAQLQDALKIYYQHSETPFGPDYPLQTVVDMRAPFELAPASDCAKDATGRVRQGYLLIHGLSDSPYLLSAVGQRLHEHNPCALIRALLMPGHGTVPGDALTIGRNDWQDAVLYGIDQFRPAVDQLTLVGYSAGATLALQYVDQHPDDTFIDALVLLSPALSLPGIGVRLSPYLRWFRQWVGIESEQDAAKYESFPIHAGAELYLLIREFRWRQMDTLTVPVFMAASSDDTTVDVTASIDMFCEKAPVGERELFWLINEREAGERGLIPADCDGVYQVAASSRQYRLVSASHVAVTLPPDDPHYGVDGAYRQCLHYPVGELRDACLGEDGQTVYGERSLLVDGFVDGFLMRRTTFNPAFDEMMERMFCLLEPACSPVE